MIMMMMAFYKNSLATLVGVLANETVKAPGRQSKVDLDDVGDIPWCKIVMV